MCKKLRVLGLAASIGAVLALVAPMAAQEPAAPTKKNPLRFTAFNYSAQLGAAGVTQVTIERWTTDAERMSLRVFRIGSPLWLGARTLASLLVVVALSRPRARALLDLPSEDAED